MPKRTWSLDLSRVHQHFQKRSDRQTGFTKQQQQQHAAVQAQKTPVINNEAISAIQS